MKAAAFDYAIPKSVAEATALLGSNGAATAAIAGGQSLLPLLNLRVALPDLVVDLARLEELKEIAATQTNIRIGALTTHAAIEDGKLPEAFGGLMQKVASKISYRAVRNHGTIGGSWALSLSRRGLARLFDGARGPCSNLGAERNPLTVH